MRYKIVEGHLVAENTEENGKRKLSLFPTLSAVCGGIDWNEDKGMYTLSLDGLGEKASARFHCHSASYEYLREMAEDVALASGSVGMCGLAESEFDWKEEPALEAIVSGAECCEDEKSPV